MPSVIGFNFWEALLILEQAGAYLPNKLGYFSTFPVSSTFEPSTQNAGIVLAQNPGFHAPIYPNSPIILTLADYPMSAVEP